ncbi:DUF6957 family protein [Amphritea pacifica]|uniref:DUF6957 domain-containing protein n=1 Tax=Amphritea pacifica TaxID=2811233 RepID=A0ABS2WDB3_9GAMM|nr:hypothetical protein [Amphritea pacifica]MBN0989362.1 hypothetical protein [Amphritea pacifica]
MEINQTAITQWFLITFFDAPPPLNRIVWGIIEADSRGYQPGFWVCSTQILNITDDGIHITKNTRYSTIGPGEEISLPVKALIELRQGVAPDEWLALNDLQSQGYSVKIEPGQE